MWWCTPAILVLGKPRAGNYEFKATALHRESEARIGYMVRPCSQKQDCKEQNPRRVEEAFSEREQQYRKEGKMGECEVPQY